MLKSNAAASKKSANAGHEKSTQGEEQNDNYLVTRVQGEDEYGRGEGEEEAEEACSAADAASEDDGSISSRSYETSRLNDEARAYDEFKQTNGREKVKELSNAKAALRACKHRVRALSERVNEIKREMDATEKEHEKRRIECLETETKTGISYDDQSKREMKLEKEIASEEEQNDNPDIIAHRVVDEVIADTCERPCKTTPESKLMNSVKQMKTTEKSPSKRKKNAIKKSFTHSSGRLKLPTALRSTNSSRRKTASSKPNSSSVI